MLDYTEFISIQGKIKHTYKPSWAKNHIFGIRVLIGELQLLRSYRPESEERRKTEKEKASRSENKPFPLRIKSAPGGNLTRDPELTRQRVRSKLTRLGGLP
jgi:hypothetical protein